MQRIIDKPIDFHYGEEGSDTKVTKQKESLRFAQIVTTVCAKR